MALVALGLLCCMQAFSSCGKQELLWELREAGATLGGSVWALLVPGHRLCVRRLQQLQLVGLDALWHMESSRARDLTHVPCNGRQILNHCTSREVPFIHFHSGT